MTISEAINTALAEGTGIYATLVKVTARSNRGGDILAHTQHTRNLDYESLTYKAMPFEPSRMARNAGTQVDNATITRLIGDLFTRLNLRGGKWAGASD